MDALIASLKVAFPQSAVALAVLLMRGAAKDLATARREGYMLIGQTSRGTVSVTCDGGRGRTARYTLRAVGIDGCVLASGLADVVQPALAALYQVA